MRIPTLIIAALLLPALAGCMDEAPEPKPNVLILYSDQWRAQAVGYAGDPNVQTPHIDRLAEEGINFRNAVAGLPVCTPNRASLLTGQRPLTNGIFMNDVQLDTNAVTIAEVLAENGYQTGYIGKWHLDGHGRSSYIPAGGRRQGFEYWKVLECTHNYNRSAYYAGDDTTKRFWEGYDAVAQTEDARQYIRDRAGDDQPFFLMLAWGTPHAPYHTAPEEYRALYDPDRIQLRPNVPDSLAAKARRDLAGYYAHATALDDMVAALRETLDEAGIADDTIILFTSDHGDLVGSHGMYNKQQPYDESIRVPMLFHRPGPHGLEAGSLDAMMNAEDIMPTLLGLAGVAVPEHVEGYDYSAYMHGEASPADTATIITAPQPFGQWTRTKHGGREYRGVRTPRYTYTRTLDGPWHLFDNQTDPYQMRNLIGDPEHAELQERLEALLQRKLDETNDEFLPGMEYVRAYGYPPLNETETVPYSH